MQMLYPDWRDKVVFSSDGPKPQTLMDSDKFKVVVGGLEAGQKIPPHPEGESVFHFLEGTGWMNVDGERFAVKPGATVVTPAGAARGIEAETRLAFLAARVA
ncbi:MAG: cupin domain-containing protein [Chloroflexota bacterium]|nr:cupin domain-containing protein [Chloroflexota bacterium]